MGYNHYPDDHSGPDAIPRASFYFGPLPRVSRPGWYTSKVLTTTSPEQGKLELKATRDLRTKRTKGTQAFRQHPSSETPPKVTINRKVPAKPRFYIDVPVLSHAKKIEFSVRSLILITST